MSQINFANTQFAKFVNYANSLPVRGRRCKAVAHSDESW